MCCPGGVNLSLELWTLVIGIVTAMSCALCGCLLTVNGKALVSEGLSHAVLPGLAVAFWYLADYNSPLLIVSAAASGLLMVWCTELLQRTGLLDSDAALGLVFAGIITLQFDTELYFEVCSPLLSSSKTK